MRSAWFASSTSLLLLLPSALGVVLNNGTSSGVRLYNTLPNGLRLQSSGFAALDECPASYALGANCVTMRLNATGNLDDMSSKPGSTPRQRVELRGPDSTRAGEQWQYSWNFRLGATTTGGQAGKFFHLGQIISGTNLPQYVLDIKRDRVQFETLSTTNTTVACSTTGAKSLAVSAMQGKTFKIELKVTYGTQKGSVLWRLKDAQGVEKLRCKASNTFVPVGTYVKTGVYRGADDPTLDVARAWVGDWKAVKL